MKRLYYVCAQPATLYYAWQVEVMVNNFLKNGIPPETIHIVTAINKDVPVEWLKLQDKFREVTFAFYQDMRIRPVYVSSIRPHILKQHFVEHPYLAKEAIFYHDCDIVLTKPVTWEQFIHDNVWYLSDTIGYIGANYIRSKKYGIYERMCELINIPEDVPIKNESSSGGAQYIMKNVNYEFWDKVERDSEILYQFFMNHLKAFPQSPTYHPIQMWTADMWAVLWNAWYFGHTTVVPKEMDFIWPGNKPADWDTKYIFHNAGVVGTHTDPGLFYKALYTYKLPYDINPSDYKKDRCSYKYVQEILETAKTSCLL